MQCNSFHVQKHYCLNQKKTTNKLFLNYWQIKIAKDKLVSIYKLIKLLNKNNRIKFPRYDAETRDRFHCGVG